METPQSETDEERVELADYAKTSDQEWVWRADCCDHPTKAVAVLVYGEDSQDFWIQQRAPGKRKSGYWEIVAGSKSVDHESSKQAAEEELKEELFGYGRPPDNLEVEYLGEVHKETDNEQVIDVYGFESQTTSFPGSEEVEKGEFIRVKELSQITDTREVTDCTRYVLDQLDDLDYSDSTLEELAKELK